MKTGDYFFDLPDELIAQYPQEKRGQSRLLTLDRKTGFRTHTSLSQLPDILCTEPFLSPSGEKPLLVFNDTKVRKARLMGVSAESGAAVEFLLLEQSGKTWKTLVQHAKRRKPGSCYIFFDDDKEIARAKITGALNEFRFLLFDKPVDNEWLDKYGHIPLPPYIKRKDVPSDSERYQTVYAKHTGSAAAPTAGLHFTAELLDTLSACGIDSAFVTLHVGLGTFQPVRSENIIDHVMHEEQFIITDENALKLENSLKQNRKIIAVGTTSLRSLESAFSDGSLKRGWQSTSIFIYPGYKFKMVDALFTNFHTPLSTLLILVSAFSDGVHNGRELILQTYEEAVKERYRFFSYGDAMLIF